MYHYRLYAFDAPSVSTPAQAFRLLASPPRRPAAADNPRLVRFMAELARSYPISARQYPNGEWEFPIWAVNPVRANRERSLAELVLHPEAVHVHQHIGALARHANAIGLQLFDPQDGTLYRPDGCGIGPDGPARTVRGDQAPSAGDGLGHRMLARLAPRLGAGDWRVGHLCFDGPHLSRVPGHAGEVRQTLKFHPKRLDQDSYRLNVSIDLSLPRIAFVWASLFGPHIDALRCGSAGAWERDLTLYPADFDAALFTAPRRLPSEMPLDEDADQEAWVDNLADWLSGDFGAQLGRLDDLRTIGEVVFDSRRGVARPELFAEPRTAMCALVLARALGRPDFDALADAIMMRFDEGPHRAWSDLLHDENGRHLEALIAHLRSTAFHFDVDRPAWRWPEA